MKKTARKTTQLKKILWALFWVLFALWAAWALVSVVGCGGEEPEDRTACEGACEWATLTCGKDALLTYRMCGQPSVCRCRVLKAAITSPQYKMAIDAAGVEDACYAIDRGLDYYKPTKTPIDTDEEFALAWFTWGCGAECRGP